MNSEDKIATLRRRATAIYTEAGKLLQELDNEASRKRTEDLLEEYVRKY